MKPESKKEKLLRFVQECDARGEPYYCELGRYKPWMPNTVQALVRAGKVKIVNGSTYMGWVDLRVEK